MRQNKDYRGKRRRERGGREREWNGEKVKEDRFMKRDEEEKERSQCLSSDDLLFSHDSASDSMYTLFSMD